MILLVVLLCGTWGETSFGQITIANPTLSGFSAPQQLAIQRAVDYWNDVIEAPPSYFEPGTLDVTISVDSSLAPGSGLGGWSYSYSFSGTTVTHLEVTSRIGIAATAGGGASWATVANNQIANSNLEMLIVHELGHVLNIMIWGLTVNSAGTQVTVTDPDASLQGQIERNWNLWSSFLYTPDGVQLLSLTPRTTLAINPATPFTFRGTNAMNVWGDGVATALPVVAESRNIGPVLLWYIH
jgi:hypothetical protein